MRTCIFCGGLFEVKFKRTRPLACDKPECQAAMRERTLQKQREWSAARPKTRDRGTVRHKPKIDKPKGSNRKCRVCGKDCWPNWFYCPAHHKDASRAFGYDPDLFGAFAGWFKS